MKFKHHLIVGAIGSLILIGLFDLTLIEISIVFLASILIDFDHYLWYGAKTKDWNPFHAIGWYRGWRTGWYKKSSQEREKFKKGIFIFHSIGFWIILYAVSIKYPLFIWVLAGIGLHISGDYLNMRYHKDPLYQKISVIYTWRKNRGKKELLKPSNFKN